MGAEGGKQTHFKDASTDPTLKLTTHLFPLTSAISSSQDHSASQHPSTASAVLLQSDVDASEAQFSASGAPGKGRCIAADDHKRCAGCPAALPHHPGTSCANRPSGFRVLCNKPTSFFFFLLSVPAEVSMTPHLSA